MNAGPDLLVGAASVGVGLFALYGAASNREWFYRLPKMQWLERRFGRGAARSVYALLGAGMCALGVSIAAGVFKA